MYLERLVIDFPAISLNILSIVTKLADFKLEDIRSLLRNWVIGLSLPIYRACWEEFLTKVSVYKYKV